MHYRVSLVLTASFLTISACKGRGESTPSKLSTSWESCQRSADCEGELRCIDERCITEPAGFQASFYRVRGDVLYDQKRFEKAEEARKKAIEYWTAGGKTPPPELWCELAETLVKTAKTNAEREEAARQGHQCVRSVAAASPHHTQGLIALAHLARYGFEGATLEQPTPPQYLTGQKVAPTKLEPKLAISIVGSKGSSKAKAAEALLAQGQDELLQCFENCEGDEKKCTAAITIKSRYVVATYAEDDGYKAKVDKYEGFDGAEDCLEEAIEDMLKDRSVRAKWDLEVSISRRMAPVTPAPAQ